MSEKPKPAAGVNVNANVNANANANTNGQGKGKGKGKGAGKQPRLLAWLFGLVNLGFGILLDTATFWLKVTHLVL